MFCLAELGAVWYSTDKKFFPMCVSVDYEELEATLLGIQVPRLESRASLTDLLQRICEYANKPHSASACTEAADKFLATLPMRVEKLQGPTVIPAEKLAEAERTRAQLASEVVGLRDELEEWRHRFEQAKQAKSLEELEALSPASDTKEWVAEALSDAEDAVSDVPEAVATALPYQLRGEGMPWPDNFTASKALNDGYLSEGADHLLCPNRAWPNVACAVESVENAQEVLRSLRGEDRDWFVKTYGTPPDLRQGAAFRKLLRLR